MFKRKRNAFTLIELVAVLVIMAIIALIATPLVMSIIRKARVSADKRSIDAYGRSIELAIAGYLMDTGSFPTSIEQLTIEYSGSQVVCSTTQLNNDSSVYLAGCTVGGRSVDYTYGSDKSPTYTAYTVGDQVTYNNVNYYVIKDSGAKESAVTLLKAEPLSVSEVNQYGGVGTDNNVVNKYYVNDDDYPNAYAKAYDINGYGGMVYYESETCYYKGRGNSEQEGCTTDYALSEVKQVVDAWRNVNALEAIEARLTTYEELSELSEIQYNATPSGTYEYIQLQYNWLYNNNTYWTMSQYNDSASSVWAVGAQGWLSFSDIDYIRGVVRPVIVLPKSVLN